MINFIRKKLRNDSRRVLSVLVGVGLLASVAAPAFAAPSNASLTLSDSRPGETTTYTLEATGLDTGQTIGCYELDFGTGSDGTGNVGIDGSGGSVSSNGFDSTATTFAWENTADAQIVRATNSSATEPLGTQQSLVFSSIDNGPTADTGYFAVFTTYTNTSCTTAHETITVQFMYTDGQQVSATVDPSFSFTVAGVEGDGVEEVNNAVITNGLDTTATTIPFGTVVASVNRIAAQDLTITTNAQNGYNIYVQATGLLSNGSDTIPFHDDAHATPGAFPSGTGFEDFGYTTEDTGISGGNFTSGGGDKWAGTSFASAQNTIASNTSAVGGGETTRVGYQLGVATTTPSGNYATTLIYTATPTY